MTPDGSLHDVYAGLTTEDLMLMLTAFTLDRERARSDDTREFCESRIRVISDILARRAA